MKNGLLVHGITDRLSVIYNRIRMGEPIKFRIIFRVISSNLFIVSGFLLFCTLIASHYSEEMAPLFLSAMMSLVVGFIFHLFSRGARTDVQITRKDAYLTVTTSWLIISLAGTLPYLLSGSIPRFTDAFFESISGFSTTGASILTDIEALPKSVLLWRSLTHWIGGIGIIVLVIMVMPSLKIGGYHLFTLESSLQEKIQPKIKAVGVRLLMIYLALTFMEIGLLLLGGMNLFESACHSFGTVATGGFSPKNSSIIGYSPYIQYVIMLFMFLSGVNYLIHYSLVKGDFNRIKANDELRFYIAVVFIIGLLIAIPLHFILGKPVEVSIRESYFQVISIISCTGFASADYMQWPAYAWTLIFLAMFLGGSTGSTAGGIKMARHLIVLRNIGRSFKAMVHPNAIMRIQINDRGIDDATNNSILSFIFLYFLVFVMGTLMMMLHGLDFQVSASSVATCMAGIGPGLGSVGPVGNFAHIPDTAKMILSGLMLLGRLEIYTVLMLFTREFWKS